MPVAMSHVLPCTASTALIPAVLLCLILQAQLRCQTMLIDVLEAEMAGVKTQVR